ncbi:stage III sporulation protein SpoIIIAB [Paenibacillus crassostreae]|uniref:Stage III sporulation protein AB n=1 Tax=Paenibacillus crassostreae TaxID=1763538 RepID=A0A167DHF1_9BACL|nr:stage III sporulation protein SpoIIIAB [Paenibacillus crassostreae]AOZ91467.1 stage III sporulation protein AB [Paenibacillus crassostreae]OAB74374.1 stage III sporulation protein AB [Paenibacillus crassostreae]
MVKLIGMLIIVLSGTLAGISKARQFENRPRQIRELILAMQRLETEISYGYTPLPEALDKMGAQMREPLKSFFQNAAQYMNAPHGLTAQESIQQALNNHWKHTSMKSLEMDVLHQLSYTLGTSDRQDQIKHLALAAQQLKHEETAAREELEKYGKLSKNLGFLVGILVVILIF